MAVGVTRPNHAVPTAAAPLVAGMTPCHLQTEESHAREDGKRTQSAERTIRTHIGATINKWRADAKDRLMMA